MNEPRKILILLYTLYILVCGRAFCYGGAGPPITLFLVSLNASSASVFTVQERPGTSQPQFTLHKGNTGSVEMVTISRSNRTLVLEVDASIGSTGWGATPLHPPGVSVLITPSTLTLLPFENATTLLTLTASQDARTGEYYYHYGARSLDERLVRIGKSSWFVIGPYVSEHAFTILDPNDFLAKDNIHLTIRTRTGASTSTVIVVRSEGQDLRVGKAIERGTVPRGVKLVTYEPQYPEIVPAKCQSGIDLQIKVPIFTFSGRYSFQLVLSAGNEAHVADIDLHIQLSFLTTLLIISIGAIAVTVITMLRRRLLKEY